MTGICPISPMPPSKKVPWMVLGMGGLMGGVYWVIDRRMKLAARAADEDRMSARVAEVLPPEKGGASQAPPLEETEGGSGHE